jgi:hypothetical protein
MQSALITQPAHPHIVNFSSLSKPTPTPDPLGFVDLQ